MIICCFLKKKNIFHLFNWRTHFLTSIALGNVLFWIRNNLNIHLPSWQPYYSKYTIVDFNLSLRKANSWQKKEKKRPIKYIEITKETMLIIVKIFYHTVGSKMLPFRNNECNWNKEKRTFVFQYLHTQIRLDFSFTKGWKKRVRDCIKREKRIELSLSKKFCPCKPPNRDSLKTRNINVL